MSQVQKQLISSSFVLFSSKTKLFKIEGAKEIRIKNYKNLALLGKKIHQKLNDTFD